MVRGFGVVGGRGHLVGGTQGGLRWGLSCGHGEGAMERRWEAEGQGSAEVPPIKSPPGRTQASGSEERQTSGVSLLEVEVVSRKHRGRELFVAAGNRICQAGVHLPQVMYREVLSGQ